MPGSVRPTPGIPADVRSVDDFDLRQRFAEDLDEVEVGTRSTFTHAMARGNLLTLGLEGSGLRYDRTVVQIGLDTLYVFDSNDLRASPDQRFIVTTPEQSDSRFDDVQGQFATFAEWSVTPVQRLTVNAGARYEFNQLNSRHDWSPRLSSTYRLRDRTRLNLAAGVYYQPPEFVVSTSAVENEDLKNERAFHFVTGVTI